MNWTFIFEQLLVYITILSPVIAYVIWNVKLNGKKWCIITSFLFLAATLYLSLNPMHIQNVTWWLGYYTLFALIYIMILLTKYPLTQFNKILAITLWMLFICGELWELPVFLYDYIGKQFIANAEWYTSHIRRLYTLATLILFADLTHIQLRKSGLLLCVSMILFFVLDFPQVLSAFPFVNTLARLVSLYIGAVFLYVGLPKIE